MSARPCTPAQWANAPLLRQGESSKHQNPLPCPSRRAQHMAVAWSKELNTAWQVKACSACCICAINSARVGAFSSAADFAPQYKDSYCNISYSPSPPLAHPVPEVTKFTAVKVSLWLLRNLISEYDHSPLFLFRIFRDSCWVNPWSRWVIDTFSLHPTIRDQGRERSSILGILSLK